jgi:hypothetical protein
LASGWGKPFNRAAACFAVCIIDRWSASALSAAPRIASS